MIQDEQAARQAVARGPKFGHLRVAVRVHRRAYYYLYSCVMAVHFLSERTRKTMRKTVRADQRTINEN